MGSHRGRKRQRPKRSRRKLQLAPTAKQIQKEKTKKSERFTTLVFGIAVVAVIGGIVAFSLIMQGGGSDNENAPGANDNAPPPQTAPAENASE